MSEQDTRIITAAEFAELHNVKPATLRRWLDAGEIPGAYKSPNTERGVWLLPASAALPELSRGRPPLAPLRPKRERHSLAVFAAALDLAEQDADAALHAGALNRIEGQLTDAQTADPAYPALLTRLDRIREMRRQRDAELLARRRLR